MSSKTDIIKTHVNAVKNAPPGKDGHDYIDQELKDFFHDECKYNIIAMTPEKHRAGVNGSEMSGVKVCRPLEPIEDYVYKASNWGIAMSLELTPIVCIDVDDGAKVFGLDGKLNSKLRGKLYTRRLDGAGETRSFHGFWKFPSIKEMNKFMNEYYLDGIEFIYKQNIIAMFGEYDTKAPKDGSEHVIKKAMWMRIDDLQKPVVDITLDKVNKLGCFKIRVDDGDSSEEIDDFDKKLRLHQDENGNVKEGHRNQYVMLYTGKILRQMQGDISLDELYKSVLQHIKPILEGYDEFVSSGEARRTVESIYNSYKHPKKKKSAAEQELIKAKILKKRVLGQYKILVTDDDTHEFFIWRGKYWQGALRSGKDLEMEIMDWLGGPHGEDVDLKTRSLVIALLKNDGSLKISRDKFDEVDGRAFLNGFYDFTLNKLIENRPENMNTMIINSEVIFPDYVPPRGRDFTLVDFYKMWGLDEKKHEREIEILLNGVDFVKIEDIERRRRRDINGVIEGGNKLETAPFKVKKTVCEEENKLDPIIIAKPQKDGTHKIFDFSEDLPLWHYSMMSPFIDIHTGKIQFNGGLYMIYEEFAYMLKRLNEMPKIFQNYSGGQTGKSTLLLPFVDAFMPFVASVDAVILAKDRFAMALLEGMMVNYVNESAGGYLKDPSKLRASCEDAPVLIERKNEHAYSGKIICQHVFNTNQVFTTNEKSHAFGRRNAILESSRIFSDEFKDTSLKRKLMQDKEGRAKLFGILLKVRERIVEREELQQNGRESITDDEIHRAGGSKELASSRKVNDDLTSKGDALAGFMDECIQPEPKMCISKMVVYDEFVKYAKDHNKRVMTKIQFGKILREDYGEDSKFFEDGGNKRVWLGMSLWVVNEKTGEKSIHDECCNIPTTSGNFKQSSIEDGSKK